MTIKSAARVGGPSTCQTSGSDATGHLKVVVRVRPENEAEKAGNFRTVISTLGDNMLVFDPAQQESPRFFHGQKQKSRNFLARKKKDMRFAFDRVFSSQDSTEDIYVNTAQGVLNGLLDGYNCSVFAYGATGAGKTFTMLGNHQCPGVIFSTMMELYDRIDKMKEEKTCDVAVSYLEVYNEQIRDLLKPSGYLPLREDPQKGVIVAGLTLHKPTDAKELLQMLHYGNTNRTQHPTDANSESSRSHAVFQVFTRQRDRTANLSADVRVAKMSLIDLAGSERATATKNRGARFREGANINRSLLALGNCINALAEGKAKGYVPYRNSKLTRMLKDSLGGNCRTVMIAAVSPSSMSYEDTYNTLKYANRAKNIKASLKRNVVNVDFHVTRYVKIVDELRLEVSQLKAKLLEKALPVAAPCVSVMVGEQLDSEMLRLEGVVDAVFSDRISIRKQLMELEGTQRDLSYRIHHKEKQMTRLTLFVKNPVADDQTLDKLQNWMSSAENRKKRTCERAQVIQGRMGENEIWLNRVEEQIKEASKMDSIPQMMALMLRSRHLEISLRDTERQVKYMKKLCRAQNRNAQADNRLMMSLLQLVRRQQLILEGHGLATSDLQSAIGGVQDDLSSYNSVAWADQSVTTGDDADSGISIGSTENSHNNFTSHKLDLETLMDMPILHSVPLTPKRNATVHDNSSPSKCIQSLPQTEPSLRKSQNSQSCPRTPQTKVIIHDPVDVSSIPLPPKPIPPQHKEIAHKTLKETVTVDSKQVKVLSPNYKCLLQNNKVNQTTVAPEHKENVHKTLNETVTINPEHVKVLSPNYKCLLQNNNVNQMSEKRESREKTLCHMADSSVSSCYPVTPVHSRISPLSCVLNQTYSAEMPNSQSSRELKPASQRYIDTGTITKVKHSPDVRTENERINVVRSMDFSSIAVTSPVCGKSFADVVKSPPLHLKQQQHLTFSPRSPLASRENLPDCPNSNTHMTERRVTFASRNNSKQKLFERKTSSTEMTSVNGGARRSTLASSSSAKKMSGLLEKHGIPSACRRPLSRSASVSHLKHIPSYMQSTQAFSRKQHNHRRSISTENIENIPRRNTAGSGPQKEKKTFKTMHRFHQKSAKLFNTVKAGAGFS